MRSTTPPAPHRPAAVRRLLSGLTATALATVAVVGVAAPSASAANATGASFTGEPGAFAVSGGLVHVRSGAKVTLTVSTTSDTRCLQVTGSHVGRQTASGPTASWKLSWTASAGEGARTVTATAYPSFNSVTNQCAGTNNGSTQATYVVDNSGPSASPTVTPAPNAAGWNDTETQVSWTAEDAGSGVPAQPYETDVVTADGIHVVSTAGATDLLGNLGPAASTTIRVDRTEPVLIASRRWAPDGSGITVTFSCTDPGKEASGIDTCLAEGQTTNAVTASAEDETVTGTATDVAGNRASLTVDVRNVDMTPPVLSGRPVEGPGPDGWYADDVAVRWTASDPESGIAEEPADTTIPGEGEGLTSSATVTNGVGLTTTATSAPAVRIDRTPPATTLVGAPEGWVSGEVRLTLEATDNLSGVASSSYRIDGGPLRTGSTIAIAEDGDHVISFTSTDVAGNVEAEQTARVRVDRTAPTIGHLFTPDAYESGAWTNADAVRVVFACDDTGGSGLASCSEPVTVTDEGTHAVDGAAADGAGNRATDLATVRIDRTAPEVVGTVSGARNAAGWYSGAVRVAWSATDALSGVTSTSAPTEVEEGRDRTASGTATDAAGNRGTGLVRGIDVDSTDPVLDAAFSTDWSTRDVPVDWSCTDALSGVGTGPVDGLVTGEGGNLSATAVCTDVAGNTGTRTVEGIRIDRTPPVTAAAVDGDAATGWYADAVEVTLAATDALSGVAATAYTVDGGEPRPYTGAFEVTGEGEHTVTFWSTDVAGNREQAAAPLSVRIDGAAPRTELISPVPAEGWLPSGDVPLAFTADDGAGSGVAATFYAVGDGEPQRYGAPVTAELPSGEHTVRFWSTDVAGNVEKPRTTTVRVDVDGPVVTTAVDGERGLAGWFTGPVTVDFACTDAHSGVATCPEPQSFAADGTHTATGTATDAVGNRSTATADGIRVDATAPTVRFSAQLGSVPTGSVPPAPTCTAVDGGSGAGSCTVSGYSTAVGTHTLTATATDVAGNTGTATQTYTVTASTVTVRGFYAPIRMGELNSVKGGSTVPVKFELLDGKKELTSTTDVASVTYRQVSCSTGTPFTAERAAASTGGTALRYDKTAGQFIQNWKTPTAEGCYRLVMTARDGATVSAMFKVR